MGPTEILLFLIPALFLFHSLAGGQGNVKTSMVSYPSQQETISGFLAQPEGPGPFPGLIVIHEWWGINDQIKDVTQKLAAEGYVSLAVDLFRGKVTRDPREAMQLSGGLPRDRAIRDMQAGIAFLKSQPNVRSNKIGSIGWCMGGTYSLLLAVNSPELAASVIYYGHVFPEKEQLGKIASPVIGFFGQEDQTIPVAQVNSFEKSMKELRKEVSVFIYPGAGHAFANPTRTDTFRPEPARDAWAKTLAFFAKHLK